VYAEACQSKSRRALLQGVLSVQPSLSPILLARPSSTPIAGYEGLILFSAFAQITVGAAGAEMVYTSLISPNNASCSGKARARFVYIRFTLPSTYIKRVHDTSSSTILLTHMK